MGYKQNMTDKKRSELNAYQYTRMLEERRVHIYPYLTSEYHEKLEKLGYNFHLFKDSYKSMVTSSEDVAQEIKKEYIESNHYAKIVCVTNKIRIKEYSVWFKPKKTKKCLK